MTRPELSGTMLGTDRADIMTQVRSAAAKYFGVECIRVELTNETIDSDEVLRGDDKVVKQQPSFVADYRAWEWHDVRYPAYGPGRCSDCSKESWPQDPIPGPKDPRR